MPDDYVAPIENNMSPMPDQAAHSQAELGPVATSPTELGVDTTLPDAPSQVEADFSVLDDTESGLDSFDQDYGIGDSHSKNSSIVLAENGRWIQINAYDAVGMETQARLEAIS